MILSLFKTNKADKNDNRKLAAFGGDFQIETEKSPVHTAFQPTEEHLLYKSRQIICHADNIAIIARSEKDLEE